MSRRVRRDAGNAEKTPSANSASQRALREMFFLLVGVSPTDSQIIKKEAGVLLINILSVANGDYIHNQFSVENTVDDAVIVYPDSITVSAF